MANPVQLDVVGVRKPGGLLPGLKLAITQFTAPTTTYAAGGYTLTAADYELSSIVAVIPTGGTTNGSATVAVLPVWNPVTGKLQFFKGAASTTITTGSGGLAEVATDDTYLNSTVIYLLVIGVPL